MPLDPMDRTDVIRASTGNLIGYVLDRLVNIHAAPELDCVAAQAKHADLLHWIDGAIQRAACRLSDRDCAEAYEILTSMRGHLGEQSQATVEGLKSTVRSVDAEFSERLRRLAEALYPAGTGDPDYVPDDEPGFRGCRAPLSRESEATQCPTTFLDLVVDERHGEVTREGDSYVDPTCRADFQVGSAEWHLFITALRAGHAGVSRARILSGYPALTTAAAVRQAKQRVNEKLRRLNVRLEDRWPLRLVSSDGP